MSAKKSKELRKATQLTRRQVKTVVHKTVDKMYDLPLRKRCILAFRLVFKLKPESRSSI